MYTHILVPTDGSPLSGNAAQHAIRLAKAFRARMTALHIVGNHLPALQSEAYHPWRFQAAMAEIEQAEADQANKILQSVKQAAEQAGIDCDAIKVSAGVTYAGIIEQADKLQCDLIVMASHGRRGLQGLLLGSETVKVLTHSKIPVLVCR